MRRPTRILSALAFSVTLSAVAAPHPFTPQFLFYRDSDFEPFKGLPAFEEYVPTYVLPRVPKPDIRPFQKHQEYRKKYVRRVPENERRKTPYSIEDLMEDPRGTVDSDYARSGKPFFVYEAISRPLYFIPGDGCPLADRKAFAEWKKKHPGFRGFNSLWEMDSDTTYFTRFWDRIEDKDLKRDLQAGFEPPHAKGKGHLRSWSREIVKRLKEFHWGEERLWPLCSNTMGYLHIFAANGATGLWYEATPQGYSAWNCADAFWRGAARQWGLPTGWYMAQHYTGFTRDGKFKAGGSRWFKPEPTPLDPVPPEASPHCGEGRSLHRCKTLYGWLKGADYIQMEGWLGLYRRKVNGKIVPSEYALDFNEIYMLSKRMDRGEPFTPLAVLTPLFEPSSSAYTMSYNDSLLEPETQRTIFNTLVPMTSDLVGGKRPLREKGEQGCFYNSEFPGFFDALCPDSGQDTAAFEKALSRYRHVLIAGDSFDKKAFDSRALAAYEKAGGKIHRYPSPECPTPEALRKLLLSIRDETMPFSLEGDAMWGVNRTEKGWLVYIINNKGVIKYSGEPEEYDLSKTAMVTVTFKTTGETRKAEVKPGDFKLMEFTERPCSESPGL